LKPQTTYQQATGLTRKILELRSNCRRPFSSFHTGWADCGHSQAEHYNRQDALCSTLDDRRNRPRAFSGLGRAGCLMG
jgi:hypothetical protein